MEGDGSGDRGGGRWGERGREVGIGYPPVHPLNTSWYVRDFIACVILQLVNHHKCLTDLVSKIF